MGLSVRRIASTWLAATVVACGGTVGSGDVTGGAGSFSGGAGVGLGGGGGMGGAGAGGTVGPGGSGGSDGMGVTAEQACADFAAAYCQLSTSCTPFFAEVYDGDLVTCRTRTQVGCASSFRANGTKYKPSELEACAVAVRALSCPAYRYEGAWPVECDRVPGELEAGATCGSSHQCKSLRCKRPFDSLCGVCTTRQPLGSSCTTFNDCAIGLLCVSRVCSAQVPAGGACDATLVCEFPLVCLESPPGTGTCGKALALGAPCDPAADACEFSDRLMCDEATRRCIRMPAGSPGQPCDVLTAPCRFGSACVTDASGQSICKAQAAEGGPCAGFDDCLPPDTCVAGVCTAPDAAMCR